MSGPSSVSAKILTTYYSKVVDLHTYLRNILALPSDCQTDDAMLRPTDSAKFREFVSGSFVASNIPYVDLPGEGRAHFNIVEPYVYMHDLIDRAQEKLLNNTIKVKNVITEGYRLNKGEGHIGRTRVGVSNLFVNTNITALQGPEWERLLQRIGEDAMFHLLTETCVFVPLPNDCLCQLTGEPIVSHKVPFPSGSHMASILPSTESATRLDVKRGSHSAIDERPLKRPRIASDRGETRGPVEIVFSRARLFYARPSYVPHTTFIVAGLPLQHVLNRLRPSYGLMKKAKMGMTKHDMERSQMEDARHLAKYIFPRQYGFSNAFTPTSTPRWGAGRLPDYADREDEIKGKSLKTPKRIKPAIKYLEQMIWRHGKCKYKALRDMACPSRLSQDKEKSLDSSVILELMSEESIHLVSQRSETSGNISTDASNSTIRPLGLTQAEAASRHKPRFAEFACGHNEVFRYAVLITRAVIPKALWGSDENFKTMMNSVKDFITFRRFETVSLHHVLQGLSTTSCKWLALDASTSTGKRHLPTSDNLKRRELLEEFVFWYFSSFLLPLLRTTFYITESSAFRNRTLYFRQDDWHVLCAPLVDRLTGSTFLKLDQTEAEEILRQRVLGSSFVRLLPKDTGVRPIVNLSRKESQQADPFRRSRSINDILQAAFLILTYEREARPELVGSAVFGLNEIHRRLKSFKAHLLSTHSPAHLPTLYFVKVDVQACFDTIEQKRLLQILKDAITEDSYMLQRYGKVNQTAGKIQRKFVKRAIPSDDHPHFLRYATQLAGLLRHAIFVDQVHYRTEAKEPILELLEQHITENIVKMGQDYYRQAIGIPQGSVLSAVLCSIFYGDLEKEHLQFTHDPDSLLLRLIDDYLFITTDLLKARRFLTVMKKGHPEYGCFISPDKTLTNFDYDESIMNVTGPNQQSFPWCACLINMSDLSVTADYERYHDKFLIDSLTIGRGRRAGATFVHKMLQQFKTKSHTIFCDTGLNPEHVIYLNVYQNFMLVAMKMHHYLKCWGLNINKNATFIQKTIAQVIDFAYATMHAKIFRKPSVNRKGSNKKAIFIWLGSKAFYTVFARKPTCYQQILKRLRFELLLRKTQSCKAGFRQVVEQGNKMMDQLSF